MAASRAPHVLPTVDRWFDTRRVDNDTTLVFEPNVDPLLRCNIWFVRGRTHELLVDTGLGVARLAPVIDELRSGKPLIVVATHSHVDHIGGLHEFPERWIHGDEADILRAPDQLPLIGAEIPEDVREMLERAGYPIGDYLVTAVPCDTYELTSFRTTPTEPTRILGEGNIFDLGNRTFQVLHLPGHSPGSVGLWEEATGVLFSGDAVYDGPLLDELPESDIRHYCATMTRLRDLPVTVVHGGHGESVDRSRLIEIADAYRERRATDLGA